MKAGLQRWARACLLMILVVLGTSPLAAWAEGTAGRHAVAGMDQLVVADPCCRPDADAGHSGCLPVCSPAGQALVPDHVELPLLLSANVLPASDVGAVTRFADLEPHPPRRLSDTI